MTSDALIATGLTIAVNATGSGLTLSEYLLVKCDGWNAHRTLRRCHRSSRL